MTKGKTIALVVGAALVAWLSYTYLIPIGKGLVRMQSRPEWVDNPRPSPFIGNARVEYAPVPTLQPNTAVKLVGHRGAMLTAPENTLPGVRAALEKGFDYVEVDVRYTADGVPVLMHDRLVHRTTDGEGPIDGFTYAELQKLDAGAAFDEAFAGVQVPRLDAVLDTIGDRACLYWHIKSQVTTTAIDLVRAFEASGGCLLVMPPVERRIVNPNVTEVLAEYWPDAPLVVPARNAAELPDVLLNYPNGRAVWALPGNANAGFVEAAHAEGLLVVVYLLDRRDTSDSYAPAVAAGVDLIVLDDIDGFRTWQSGQSQGQQLQ